MDQKENKFSLSKKGKREISPFIGHELLYDFLCGRLDQERHSAVADHVKYSRDAQLDVAKIQSGEAYVKQLSGTIVSQPIIQQINTTSTYFSTLLQKTHMDKWPQGLKWGLEALVVVIFVVTLLTVAPWQKVLNSEFFSGPKEVILAEATKLNIDSKSIKKSKEENPQFVDEDTKGAKQTQPPAPQIATKSENVIKDNLFTVKVPNAESIAGSEKADIVEQTQAKESKTVEGGFLYRGEITVSNLEVMGPKITEKIKELGGRKAGAVELGWQKTPTSLYYHVTIPEAKYQELSSYLSTYGKSKIVKDKHPRIMPDGIIRLIITVDETKQ